MICQSCGIEAQTRHVAFYQNIGMLIMRQMRSIEGNLCKSCIHSYFWKLTSLTLLTGWWGTISFFINPFLVLNNVFRYIFCLGMHPVSPDARQPELSEADVTMLHDYQAEIIERLNQHEKREAIAEDIAERTGLTPGQVWIYAAWLESHC